MHCVAKHHSTSDRTDSQASLQMPVGKKMDYPTNYGSLPARVITNSGRSRGRYHR